MPFYFNPRTPSQNATEGGLWKNEAIANIKQYFSEALEKMPHPIKDRITIIG